MAKSKTVREYKRDHSTFFKNGNIDQRPEIYRVWRGYLIVIEISRIGYHARAWIANGVGTLIPFAEKNVFLHADDIWPLNSVVDKMREQIDKHIEKTFLNDQLGV